MSDDTADAAKPNGQSVAGCGGCLMVIGLVAVVFVIWFAIALGKSDSDAASQGSGGAEVACERAVKTQVIDAKIDNEQSVQMSDARWVISGYVTGTNQLGGKARVHFHCDGTTVDGGETWGSSNVVIGD